MAPLLDAVTEQGYEIPTPIQQQAIPPVLAGKDLLGIAQTGTGKTAAFALPILQRLAAAGHAREPKCPRALVLAPTRELAIQVQESFLDYGAHMALRTACIFGGVGDAPQKAALMKGVDILVATPGRLLDLQQQRCLSLHKLEIFVLDEADRMLDMGFIHDIRKVVAMLPGERQNLFFSATMPPDIAKLAGNILRSPVRVEVVPASTPIERIEQVLYKVDKKGKQILLRVLMQDPSITRALVFSRTKHGANRIAEHLEKAGVPSAAIHGNKSQTRRQEALGDFKSGAIRVLVATDIAARGIDVDGVSHVFNFDLPDVPETYVHRIGRTARAGASGKAVAFCAPDELDELKQIEKLTRLRIPEADPAPLLAGAGPEPMGVSLTDDRPERPQQGRRPERSRSATTSHKGRSPQGNSPQGNSRQPRPMNNRDSSAYDRGPAPVRNRGESQAQNPAVASGESGNRRRSRHGRGNRNGEGQNNANVQNNRGSQQGGRGAQQGQSRPATGDSSGNLLSKLGQGLGKLFGR